MADNVTIRITAEVTDLQAKFAVARAESAALTRELSALAKQAASGNATDELKAKLLQVAEASLNAKNRVAELQQQLDKLKPPPAAGKEGLFYQFLDIAVAKAAFDTFERSVESVGHAFEGTAVKAEEFALTNAKFAALLGTDEQSAASLAVALKGVGSSSDEYATMALKLDRAVRSNEKSLNALGVTTRDHSGELLSQTALMQNAITTMQTYKAGTDQNEFALAAFGRGAKEVYDIMRVTQAAQQQYTDDMKTLGVVTGSDATEASVQFEEALARQKQQIEDVKIALGQHLMPILTAYVAQLNDSGATKAFEDVLMGLAETTMEVSAGIVVAYRLVEVAARETTDLVVGLAKTTFDIATGDYEGAAEAASAAWNHMKADAANAGIEIGNVLDALDADITHFEMGVRGAANSTTTPFASGDRSYVAPPKASTSNKAANDARRMADEEIQAQEQADQKRVAAEQSVNSFLLEMGQRTLDAFIQQARDLEDQRYSIALTALHKKQEADAGDKVAHAKDIAQEAVLAQDHADKLAGIDQEYARKKRQIEQTELQDFIKANQDRLTQAIAHYDAEYKSGQVNAQQKHDLERSLTLDIQQQVLARFDAENAALVAGTEAYAQAMRQRRELVDSFSKHVQQEDDTLAKEEAAKWIATNREIISAEGSFISSYMSGQQTLGQSLLQAGEQLVEKEVAQDAAYWTERALLAIAGVGRENAAERGGFLMNLLFDREKTASAVSSQATQTAAAVHGAATETAAVVTSEATQTAATKAGETTRTALGAADNASFVGRLVSQVAQWLGFETAKTADTVAGTTARSTSAAAEAIASVAAAKALAAGEIPAYTGIAAMEAASAVADIPIVGPALAAAAIAEMDALGAAQLTLASAAGGMESVPEAEMLMVAHKKESVLPARISEPLMTLIQNAPIMAGIEALSHRPADISRPTSTAVTLADADPATRGTRAGAGASGDAAAAHFHFHGNALHIDRAFDGHDIERMFQRNDVRRAFEKQVKEGIRRGMRG